MAFKHGSKAGVAWNQYDVSGYLRSAELNVGVEPADTSVFGLGWKTSIVGLAESSFSAEGLYDPATQAYWRDQLAVSSGVLTYAPSGWAAVGDPARLLIGTSTAYGESSPVGDAVAFSWEVMSDDHFAAGQVLHPFSEDTNTTTGSSKNDSSATTTGWTAHLHVSAVDGGSWLIRVQDSADNSAWSVVVGLQFDNITAATASRLESSTATAEVRQYVRYTATRTGGSAGDGVTFLLAYARTGG